MVFFLPETKGVRQVLPAVDGVVDWVVHDTGLLFGLTVQIVQPQQMIKQGLFVYAFIFLELTREVDLHSLQQINFLGRQILRVNPELFTFAPFSKCVAIPININTYQLLLFRDAIIIGNCILLIGAVFLFRNLRQPIFAPCDLRPIQIYKMLGSVRRLWVLNDIFPINILVYLSFPEPSPDLLLNFFPKIALLLILPLHTLLPDFLNLLRALLINFKHPTEFFFLDGK